MSTLWYCTRTTNDRFSSCLVCHSFDWWKPHSEKWNANIYGSVIDEVEALAKEKLSYHDGEECIVASPIPLMLPGNTWHLENTIL